MPHAQEGKIRAQNAQRIGRRKQAAALAAQVSQVSGSNLSRFGETRKVGGRFERIQKVPKRKVPKSQGLDLTDLYSFLSAFSFGDKRKFLGSRTDVSNPRPGKFNPRDLFPLMGNKGSK